MNELYQNRFIRVIHENGKSTYLNCNHIVSIIKEDNENYSIETIVNYRYVGKCPNLEKIFNKSNEEETK
jgi:hypothetical protein